VPSSYSPLKIELIATGENTGTWGDITNINLGTALEEAITGSADVAFSNANITLTLTNTNTSQAARNLRLNLTGTTGAPRNLVVPSIEKLYLINNTCADAVTVKTAAGTGIAVPSGKTMFVYNNGTNVVDAVTHLSSLSVTGAVTAGSASVTGAVTAGSASVTGAVAAGSAAVTGAVTAGSAAVTGAVTAGSASVTGDVAAGSATVTGAVSAGSAAVTGAVSAGSAAVTGAVSAGSASFTTPLGVASGGTGAATLTANNVLLGNGTSAPLTVAPGTTGNVLTSDGTTWTSASAPAGGQYLGTAAIKAIAYNAQTIGENITISSTQNGLSSGPITVNSGFTVTIASGGNWAIV
jgi:hypothetical protein